MSSEDAISGDEVDFITPRAEGIANVNNEPTVLVYDINAMPPEVTPAPV